ncbi:hypothetical protein G7085_09700 [Tessaracoccus sp. HDW20]|uniref:phosphorylase family protein n=1 Tax=Tessaracoccus coleopterorum TaxID=2714950 RepID=UPI0018D2DA88|nr:DUF1801 domain-containing protein [Tessaracoccus coleopterorum]NHB84786.1 hypothetical protein [Tessaracoccus coleopterorum]
MPKACVLTWFRDAADRMVETTFGRRIVQLRWEDGPRPVYAIEHDSRTVALAPMPVGGAPSAALLEELIALGCRSFIACGGAGALRPEFTAGHAVLVTSSLRDEGASHHYLPPSRTVEADNHAVSTLRRTLTEAGVPFDEGRTWTTDGLYRETADRIAARVAEDCVTVEMEAASVAAVAEFRVSAWPRCSTAAMTSPARCGTSADGRTTTTCATGSCLWPPPPRCVSKPPDTCPAGWQDRRMGTIDEYLAGLPDADAEVVRGAYDVAQRVVPQAEQGLGYGMPALTYRGKPLLSVMRARQHFGIYPFSGRIVEDISELLEGIDHAKGTIRVRPGQPLPDAVIEAIVERRRAEIDG